MDILIGHTTELELTRSNRHIRQALIDGARLGTGSGRVFPTPTGTCDSLREQLRSLGAQTEPFDIVCTEPGGRHVKKSMRVHQWGGPYPDGTIIRLGRALYGCSAPVLFCQLQRKASPGTRALLAYELCGTYAVSSNGTLSSDLGALTSVDELRAFVRAHPSFSGARKAALILKYVADGAASPMEARIAVILCLPVKLGGFGLPVPVLNHKIELSDRTIYVDLFWPEAHIGIEYDSREWHVGQHKFEQDSRRRNASRKKGIELITVTKPEVQSPQEFEDIAARVARQLGKRVRRKSDEFYRLHAQLRAEVFPFWKSKQAVRADSQRIVFRPEDVQPVRVFGAQA